LAELDHWFCLEALVTMTLFCDFTRGGRRSTTWSGLVGKITVDFSVNCSVGFAPDAEGTKVLKATKPTKEKNRNMQGRKNEPHCGSLVLQMALNASIGLFGFTRGQIVQANIQWLNSIFGGIRF
jgi:hypothetical protein